MAKGNKPRSITGVPPDESLLTRSENGLGRWSRRKVMARAENNTAPSPRPLAEDTARAAATNSSITDKTDADMPAINSLKEDSDYTAFLSPKVSEKLRRMAMRKLFHLPQFNFVDGLDDYADDYTFFVPLGDIITADMRHHMDRELEAEKERADKKSGDNRDDEISAGTETDESQVAVNENESSPTSDRPDESIDEPAPAAQTTELKETKKGKG